MRDLVPCTGEKALSVFHPRTRSIDSSTDSNVSCSVKTAVSYIYRSILCTQKQLLITVSWSRGGNMNHPSLSISFGNNPSRTPFTLGKNSWLFGKNKGNKKIQHERFGIEVLWDFSNANYDPRAPEPVDGFYLLVMVDSEVGLLLGDMSQEAVFIKFKVDTPVAKFSLISRREHFLGNSQYSTKVRFGDGGDLHEILIKSSGELQGRKNPYLSVYIDSKMVGRVNRLQWNFRGSQTIFTDGLAIDLMWDVHDWFFDSEDGNAVFMFQTRSRLERELWLDNELDHKMQNDVEFSLLIYASKSCQ